MQEFIEIFRHQQPFVAEMALSSLKKNGIACYTQQVAITGLATAVVIPTAAPGVEYVVYVPKNEAENAKKIVDELPIYRKNLNVPWTGNSKPKRNRLLLVYWIIITGLFIPFFILIFHILLKLLK